jgi:hypothetical protein
LNGFQAFGIFALAWIIFIVLVIAVTPNKEQP